MRLKLMFVSSLTLCSVTVHAQESGWSKLGEALGSRDREAVDMVSTNLDGTQANRAYTSCLEARLREYAPTGQNAFAMAAAAKGACAEDRRVFYSAVYNDMRKNSGRNASIRAANAIISNYDADIDNKLPGLAIAAKQKAHPGDTVDKYSQIERLKGLLESGALNQAEFDAEKAKILGDSSSH
ncbi:SHOCT domain-containing protein [Stenotrophomonas tumulicola]|uniref:SHOCT domain-containing protein n=1 Tax=Stenotrophomonas tumulicola TaxID=1685415 RepID=A0A7W3FJ58_9GAMM|nr:SHOCT domain-containing protein [Stenotrophomonas tumulicola]MBA8680518.1 SHOCT domain-containing protein [Stenotrophomonas tumulicola]